MTSLPPQPSPPEASLERRFFRLTVLNILANLTLPLAGLVDLAMLGHLTDLRFLAGVALGTVIFDYIYWIFGFLRMGTTGLTAQAVGRGDREEVYRVLYRGLAVALGVGSFLVLAQWPLREGGFFLLGGAPGVEAAGREYFVARIWAAPASLANFAFLGWFLGREESGRALLLTLTANLGNIALNYVFILRLGLAAQGAGLATACSQVLALGVAAALFLSRPNRPRLDTAEVLDRRRLGPFLRLNRDILIRTLCLETGLAVFLNVSAVLSTEVLAANGLLLRLFLLAAFFIDGAAFAAESLGGILRGGGRERTFRRLVRLSMASGAALAGLFLVVVLAAPGRVLALLTSHQEVLALGAELAPWLAPVLLVGSVAFVYDGLFLGLTAGRALRDAMLFSLGAYLPVAAAAWWLASPHLLWLAMTAFMVARAATLGLLSRRVFPQQFVPAQAPVQAPVLAPEQDGIPSDP